VPRPPESRPITPRGDTRAAPPKPDGRGGPPVKAGGPPARTDGKPGSAVGPLAGRGASQMYSPIASEKPTLSAIDQLKVDLHRRLIERLDLDALEQIKSETEVAQQIRAAVLEFLRTEATPLSQTEREDIVEQIVYEVIGLGPIEPLFRDPTVSDILVNGARHIYIERGGRLSKVHATFRNDAHLLAVIDRIVSRVGRRVDEASPMVDARLPDGSRVNAIIPPLAVDGPLLSIRRFPAERLKAEDLVTLRALTRPMLDFLIHCVRARLNGLISGGTGAGKTTLLNVMSGFIGDKERIVTIEDAAELQLHQEHVARLETRPPNVEGKGAVKQRQLMINALRMRPDRIVVGEVRGEEALDMLQAMNTGHDGSLTTVHANTPRDALTRIETMIAMGAINLPERAMRQQIASAIQLVVQQTRMSDGSRKVTSISEITGMEGDTISMQEIFVFDKMGVTQDGKVIGRFRATGVRPKCCERLKMSGIHLPADMFEGVTEVR
jgi:pilus assembly protein CpaF